MTDHVLTDHAANPATTSASVTIRAPEGREQRACRMIIPGAYGRAAPTSSLLALWERPRAFLGAAAGHFAVVDEKPRWRIWLQVVDNYRGQGVGSRLLDALADQGRRHGAADMTLTLDSVASPAGADFVRRHGFTHRSGMITYEADAEAFVRVLMPLKTRIVERGNMPDTARLVPLSEAPGRGVTALWRKHLGGQGGIGGPVDRDWLARAKTALSNPCTVVLMVEGEVRAMMLSRLIGDVMSVEARVVDDTFRGGWANLMIMATGLEQGLENGVKRIRFKSAHDNRDTIKLARRANARALAQVERYTSALQAA